MNMCMCVCDQLPVFGEAYSESIFNVNSSMSKSTISVLFLSLLANTQRGLTTNIQAKNHTPPPPKMLSNL